MDLYGIDWNAIWREQIALTQGRGNGVDIWNQAAPRWSMSRNNGNYVTKFMDRVHLEPDWTVLDVGCGAGALAIPLAKKVKRVTALDGSANMLHYLRQNAASEGVSNIDYVNQLFSDAVTSGSIGVHDVVVASRSIGLVEHDLKAALTWADALAGRAVYITQRASERTFDIGVHSLLGRQHHDSPSYVIIYNLLFQMGIQANVEFLECEMSYMFESLDSAVEEWRRRFARRGEPLTEQEEEKLRSYLEAVLRKRSDGKLEVSDRKPAWALIWWRKG